MTKNLIKKTDYLIIGGGIAGLSLALKLVGWGSVLLITKTRLRQSASYYAQGGIAAVTDIGDSWEEHFQDTMMAGAGYNKKSAVLFLVKNAFQAISFLEKWGCRFNSKLTREGGHQKSRIHHIFDKTGQSVINHLIKAVQRSKSISIMEGATALDLIKENEVCQGCFLRYEQNNYTVIAKYTILATGGLGQIFSKTSNPVIATGDGLAMAYRAGAKIKDLEFMQFHPTALDLKEEPYLLLSETLRGEGGYLINEKGVRFMTKIHSLKELAPRDIVTRAIYNEQKKGGVFLDLRHLDKKFVRERFPYLYQKLKIRGFDLGEDLIPITPVMHYCCGGVVTNLKGQTTITNLYALGEVAWTGVHGANRLASNSLLEGVVFAEAIVQTIKNYKFNTKNEEVVSEHDLELVFEQQGDKLFRGNLRQKIRQIMWEKVGIIRTKQGLKEAWQQFSEISDPIDYQTQNILTCAKLVTKMAIRRDKSLGGHWLEG